MSKMQDLYTGLAGQAAVMSEFLMRGYNVAVPEVDRSDDLFVVHDINGNYQHREKPVEDLTRERDALRGALAVRG